MPDIKYCTKCGHVGEAGIEEESRYSVAWGILLFLLGIIPGIIYWLVVGSADRYWVCRKCCGRGCLVPIDSPVAQQSRNLRGDLA